MDRNNKLITIWQKSMDAIITAKKTLLEISNQKNDPIDDIRKLASKQLDELDRTKPIKDKSLREQCNEEQLQFINYLEDVILYGNLEGENKCTKIL